MWHILTIKNKKKGRPEAKVTASFISADYHERFETGKEYNKCKKLRILFIGSKASNKLLGWSEIHFARCAVFFKEKLFFYFSG
mmetsp:Transcript_3193/g.4526  ORF Transcript_3193/g.4526 Transcript_3193/m.4526 type:complete len:83 (+) Transcript_3193:156-404(+)